MMPVRCLREAKQVGEQCMAAIDAVKDLKGRIAQSVIGQEAVIDRVLVALLANGHVLVEGLPGLAKTRTIKTLAANLESEFKRIQFTPDLLPSDITGAEVYVGEGASGSIKFQPGPVFGNLILADEINRAPAKAQSALLEAMEERQVTVAGKTTKLPELFMVMATQNPIEQEGTYPLPEAQMDRFLLHVLIDYPSDGTEKKVLKLVRGEEAGEAGEKKAKIPGQTILDARKEVGKVFSSEAIEDYIVALVGATRRPKGLGVNLEKWVRIGASPRGTLALDRASRAYAWMNGKDHVSPEDVRAVAHDCLRHRLILTYDAAADGVTKNQVVDELIKVVAVA